MIDNRSLWDRIWNTPSKEIPQKETLREVQELIEPKSTKQILPPGMPIRQVSESSSSGNAYYNLTTLKGSVNYINPTFNRELIPVIRKLGQHHPDISQGISTLVQLCNTGYKIRFDPRVKAQDIDKMRAHLDRKLLEWGADLGGDNGLINRVFRQIFIAGTIAGEWVPKKDLTTLTKCALIKPEQIYYAYDKLLEEWMPYQQSTRIGLNSQTTTIEGLIPLNKRTFRYVSLMGDDDLPYGIPPMLAALDSLTVQKDMIDNLRHIVKQLGIIGFMQALLDKPDKLASESEAVYKSRMEALLTEAATRLQVTLKDGISVGFKDDVEFEFHTPTKSSAGADDLYIQNDLRVFAGMKMDSSMMGRSYGTSEGQIVVVFNKLLSELKNAQNCARIFFEYGFKLELVMAGFKFETLELVWNSSTLSDDLKLQQGQEIKIRNIIAKFNQGIIDNDQAADELGYEEPNKKEPRIMTDPAAGAQKKQKREGDKNKSDRAVRKKNRPGDKSQKSKGTKNN